jgi:hypothetical protein
MKNWLNFPKNWKNFIKFTIENTQFSKKFGKRKDHFFPPKHQWLQYTIVMHQTPKLLSYLWVVGKVCNMDE